jgi:hypothetical protein
VRSDDLRVSHRARTTEERPAPALGLGQVLVVGSLSLALPEAFPRATVWSTYGLGYGFLPLVLPIAGLWWLLRDETRRAYRAPPAAAPA